MRFKIKTCWLNMTISGALLFTVVAAIFAGDNQHADVGEFESIRAAWERVVLGYPGTGKPVPPLTGKERAAANQRLADQCLQLADKHPNTQGALAALYLAACRAPDLDAGKQALRRLSERMSTIDLGEFERAAQLSLGLITPEAKHVYEEIAPVIIERIKQSPDQPRAAALLARICAVLGFDSQTEAPPQHFTEAADLIAARYADSPDIYNFCESLGGMHDSPRWAGGFEKHVQKILAGNEERWVRCTGSLALASIAQLSIDRQGEAEKLYEQFLKDFDGQTQGPTQNVEQTLIENAKRRLTAMRFAPTGRPAPEIVGVDLAGKEMKLSDYRGRVVVVSFWATWCAPCMKLIPHERELAARLADKPFAVIGINADSDEDAIQKALDKHKITWRSFQNVRPGKESISEEWNALYPTVFLIDHKGIFRKRWTGAPPIDELNLMIDELVAEAADKQNK